MNTSPAQQPNPAGDSSYVDAYTPPSPALSTSTTQAISKPITEPMNDANDQTMPPTEPPQPIVQPPQPIAASTQSTATSLEAQSSEALEDQNIFFLLGVRDGTNQQKESFLDELQQVIWEDFLEYDVKLLVTSDESAELQKIIDSSAEKDLEKQEKIIVYLEKLIPDLEEIMLEKALELKEEMVRERVSSLRQFYADQADKLTRVDEAERLLNDGKWYSGAHVMNSLAQA
ncbi:MAG: hypothetical protein COY81_04380 [Candidatus Pacebacteria bacterium CG_4_10_14_0_8_um_filter_43_12]|nr:MAG: hypothetical protein COU66_04095 [Candidatus Pacebacteria bacterium CG10_big_fil_rev_8_21_14_0_10_44_11]PIY79122.1 MAG: hypothetical protein COY81_04380 [Candidatus Pacebacteria bacterium CG_4_10_14_0_8_um_filter_43_12]